MLAHLSIPFFFFGKTFTAKFYEKVEGLAKLSSLQGQVLGEVRDTVLQLLVYEALSS
jgi:hypothetical protein